MIDNLTEAITHAKEEKGKIDKTLKYWESINAPLSEQVKYEIGLYFERRGRMTVGDLKRLLEGIDESKIVVFRDSMNGWCNLQNSIDTTWDYVVLLEDSDVLFND